MTKIKNNKDEYLVSSIYTRALCLTIGKDFAHQKCGNVYAVQQQESEQTNRRRELLDVEEESHQNKIIETHGQNHFKNQVMQKFFNQVNCAVNDIFDHKEDLYKRIWKVEDTGPHILEILSVKSASVNRITPLVKSLPWLCTELINLVNKPQYRKRADIKVTDVSLALSYIGLDNLKVVIPTFFLKHWLPKSTSPHPLMKRKIWNDSLAVAMASGLLAKSKGLDEFTALTAGMLSNIGLLVVTKYFISSYANLYATELKTAYDNRDKKLHDAILEFNAAPELLLEQLLNRSTGVSTDLIKLMRFDRLQITETMCDLESKKDFNKMCAIAKTVTQAKAYVTYRNLAKEKLIDSSESKQLLTSVQLTKVDLTLLKNSNIDHIKLNFKEP